MACQHSRRHTAVLSSTARTYDSEGTHQPLLSPNGLLTLSASAPMFHDVGDSFEIARVV
jgi:hypothetical protein